MYLEDLIWPSVRALNKNIPAAAVRQCGHHLPMDIGSVPAGELVQQTERELRDHALLTPNVTCRDPELFAIVFGKAHSDGVMQERANAGCIASPLHARAETDEHFSASFSTGVRYFRNPVKQWDGKSWQ